MTVASELSNVFLNLFITRILFLYTAIIMDLVSFDFLDFHSSVTVLWYNSAQYMNIYVYSLCRSLSACLYLAYIQLLAHI